ncbi:MAG: DnaB-like helicase N-terminal domain-containing protein, partial [Terriglobia bacterium]
MPTTAAIDKAVPHNLEAERALLGSILLDNSALNVALEFLKTADFYSDAHRMAFDKMVELSERNRPAELVTLAEELEKDGLLEKAGGRAYLASLIDGVPIASLPSASAYAQIVKEKAIVRGLINASQNIIARCYSGTDDSETLLDLAQSQIFEIAEKDVQSGFSRVQD